MQHSSTGTAPPARFLLGATHLKSLAAHPGQGEYIGSVLLSADALLVIAASAHARTNDARVKGLVGARYRRQDDGLVDFKGVFAEYALAAACRRHRLLRAAAPLMTVKPSGGADVVLGDGTSIDAKGHLPGDRTFKINAVAHETNRSLGVHLYVVGRLARLGLVDFYCYRSEEVDGPGWRLVTGASPYYETRAPAAPLGELDAGALESTELLAALLPESLLAMLPCIPR